METGKKIDNKSLQTLVKETDTILNKNHDNACK